MPLASNGREELLLILAGTTERRERLADRAAAALRDADLPELLDELERQRLAPLMGRRIPELTGALPVAIEQRLHEIRDQAQLSAGVQDLLMFDTLGTLDESGIAAAPLKGPHLSTILHGAPWLRASHDIDLLLTVDQLPRAVELLAGMGWRPRGPASRRTPRLHADLYHPKLPPVELHWRVHWYERDASAAMLARADPAPSGGRRLQTEDHLAVLLLCYARDGFVGLRYPTDIAAWWDRYGAQGPPVLADWPARHPRLARALIAAATLAEDLTGIPAGALVGRSPLPRRSTWAYRLADPFMRRSKQQRLANISLADGLLAPRSELLRFSRRQVLISREVVLARHPGTRHPAMGAAEHAARILRRYGLAAWELARSGDSGLDVYEGRGGLQALK